MRSTVTAAGRTRSFTVVGDADGPEDRALVLVFHGSRQNGEIHRRFTGGALDHLADDGRAVVAYLDGHRGNWNDARAESSFPARLEQVDDVAFARAVVDSVLRSHRIDPRRVIGVGYSNGGQMIFRLIHDAPDLLAGAVIVAATMPDRAGFLGPFSEDVAEHPIPVTLVAGTADRIVPYKGGRMAWWARALFKVGGVALSAPATAEYFARRNGITAPPMTRMFPTSPGTRRRPRMDEATYCEPGHSPVTLYTVRGGGHAIPGPKKAPGVLGRTGVDRPIETLVLEVLARDGSA
ncbi:hypothetical protein N1031_07860 [Herbiconiux moechotypicola]|uniref:PHB depolymerase family esterase n=1 Tax=Herbiconiux moechotypicola TaxID=637393 RepID=A0ABN3DHZ3_9MICO|nr:PHB depolymerase family esterase [Herbiconiux moechotypicola]MCS5729674.1 hypothetical protein [Herbiconiux moechotypicola]